MEEASEILERSKLTRVEIFKKAVENPCAISIAMDSGSSLPNNMEWRFHTHLPKVVRNLLAKGKAKHGNTLIKGPANTGKTFLLNPINVV